jgi:glutamate synthase (NADPH/NADH) small chain
MSKHIFDDARRCLQCKKPICENGCPIGTPIRDMVTLFLDNKVEEAGKLLFDNNPLSLVCSHVCPQENQCEGHCVLAKKSTPIIISDIERYISDFYLNIYQPTPSTREKGKVAVIGSGPAGMTVAFVLAGRDYDVTLFEANEHVGGVLRYGIPEFRLPKAIMYRIQELLFRSGIRIRPNTTIGMNLVLDDLFRDGFGAVFMGTGVWRPLRLNIKGESLGHVHYSIEYLKHPSSYRLGKNVAIIGAGNVAMDVARTVIRSGCRNVTAYIHLDESDSAARPDELSYARIDGLIIEPRKLALEITDEGIVFADTEIKYDEEGNRTAEAIPGTERLIPADSVIIAVSQGPRSVIVSSTTGIEVNEKGLVVVDCAGRTTREGVFAAGDVVTGANTVVEAAQSAKRVADEMDKYMQNKNKI